MLCYLLPGRWWCCQIGKDNLSTTRLLYQFLDVGRREAAPCWSWSTADQSAARRKRQEGAVFPCTAVVLDSDTGLNRGQGPLLSCAKLQTSRSYPDQVLSLLKSIDWYNSTHLVVKQFYHGQLPCTFDLGWTIVTSFLTSQFSRSQVAKEKQKRWRSIDD